MCCHLHVVSQVLDNIEPACLVSAGNLLRTSALNITSQSRLASIQPPTPCLISEIPRIRFDFLEGKKAGEKENAPFPRQDSQRGSYSLRPRRSTRRSSSATEKQHSPEEAVTTAHPTPALSASYIHYQEPPVSSGQQQQPGNTTAHPTASGRSGACE